MNYLTSIRGLAALLVVLFHVKHYLVNMSPFAPLSSVFSEGYLAVDFFLILSGFILSYRYADEFKANLSTNFADFIARRFARIYPLHAFVMLCFLILPVGLYVSGRGYQPAVYGVSSFVAKFLLVDLWIIGHQVWDTWNVPSWTISGEFCAYLLFPVLVHVFQRVSTWMQIVLTGAALAVMVGFFNTSGCGTLGDCIGQLGLLRCVVEFLLGMFVWFSFDRTRQFGERYFILVFAVSLAMWFVAFRSNVPNYWFVPPLFAATLYGLVGFRSVLHQALEFKPLVYLGEVSYSVYLTHLFMRDLLFKLFLANGESPTVTFLSLYIAATLLFSIATYHLVEMPFRKRAYLYLRPKREPAPVTVA